MGRRRRRKSKKSKRRSSKKTSMKNFSKSMSKTNKKTKKVLSNINKKISKSKAVKNVKKKINEELKQRIKIEKEFRDGNIRKKITIVFKAILRGITKFMEDIAVFFIAALSVMYLYYKFENKNINSIFPSNPEKFPYVAYEDGLPMDEQRKLTSSIIDETATFAEEFYDKIKGEYNENGTLDDSKMRQKIGQPDNMDTTNMNPIADFFNFTSEGKTSVDINLIQLISYVLVSGIIGVNSFMGQLHNIFKRLYITKEQANGNYILKSLCYIATFFLITLTFFLYRMSKNDLSNLLMPIISSSSKEFTESVFGIPQIIQLFSSLFSGFFSFFKIIFVIGYLAFIFYSILALLRINNNLSSLTTVILSFVMMLTFIGNLFMFLTAFINTLKKTKSIENFSNTIFKEILKNIQKAIGMFKNVSGKDGSIIGKLFNLNKVNMNNFTSIIMFVVSLPIVIFTIPLILIPIVFMILGIVFTFIPFIGTLFSSTSITYDFTTNGLHNIFKMKDIIKNNYGLIVLSFFMSLVFIMNSLMKGQKGILAIVQLLISVIFSLFMIISYFMIKKSGKNVEDNLLNVNATPVANNTTTTNNNNE